jgi:hypothetical protein
MESQNKINDPEANTANKVEGGFDPVKDEESQGKPSITDDSKFKVINTYIVYLIDILGKGNYGVVYKAWKTKNLPDSSQYEHVYPDYACKLIDKTKLKETSFKLIENEI